MHELSLCQALVDQVQRIAGDRGARGVESIILRIGPLSGVEPDLLRNAFPLASAGTVAEHARLVIETQPLQVRCPACGQTSEVSVHDLSCRACGEWRTTLESGDAMLLESLVLIVDEAAASTDQ